MGSALPGRRHGRRRFAGRLIEGMVSLPQQARAHAAGFTLPQRGMELEKLVHADGLRVHARFAAGPLLAVVNFLAPDHS